MTARPRHLESRTVVDFFGTPTMRAVFADQAVLQAWLDVEAALARGQAHLGVVPAAAADTITRAARLERLDLDALDAEAADTVHPLVPLIRVLTAACGDAGRYVHLGATTQDVMDTGYILRVREGLEVTERRLDELLVLLRDLTARHRDTPMAARTHGQQATPTTFGLRCAVWLVELARHRERLDQLRTRLLVVSMGGAAGTMAGYGPDAFILERHVADDLGLAVAATPWHASPDRFAECLSALGLIASSAEKLAREVYSLGRTEIGELHESQRRTQVGSSTMPHKANPIRCEAVIAAASTLRAQAPLAMQAMVSQDDRDMGAGMVLWKLVPECFFLLDGVLERLVAVFSDLGVDPARMRANLERTGGLVLSEAVMLRLAESLGREEAHHLVTGAARESTTSGRSFADALREDPRVGAALAEDELARLLDPSRYLGHAGAIVDRALASLESP